jgi:flagellar basal body-associated protein FliL
LTIVFFVILVVVAFAADRYNAAMMKKNETEEDAKRIAEENAKKSKKHELRTFAKNFAAYGGDQVMIEIATGMTTPNTQKVSDNEK